MPEYMREAYNIYLNALNTNKGNLTNAAITADKKGWNWTCDYQDAWYQAVRDCSFDCY